MEVKENIDYERCCDNCGALDYTFDIKTDDDYPVTHLCKKCLLKLLKAIIER